MIFIAGRLVRDIHAVRGTVTAYYARGTDIKPFEAAMLPEEHGHRRDDAFVSGKRDSLPSFTFRHSNGKHLVHVYPAEMWGIDALTEAEVAVQIAEMQEAMEAYGETFAPRVTTAARRLFVRAWPRGMDGTEQQALAPRWRRLAIAAIHQGPTLVCRGGAAHAQLWDRREAFLTALLAEGPARLSWRDASARDPAALLESDVEGIVSAEVTVDPARFAESIPPLPAQTYAGLPTLYPVGTFGGTWTLRMLRDAVEGGGVTVDHIREAMTCTLRPVHGAAYDWIASIGADGRVDADVAKRLRKRLYTRYWGAFAYQGGISGWVPTEEERAERLLGDATWFSRAESGLAWESIRLPLDSLEMGTCYRPDLAAFIAADNHITMNRAIRAIERVSFPGGALLGAHIDAVWVDADRATLPALGPDFRIKAEGACRFYATGTYVIGSKSAGMGILSDVHGVRLRGAPTEADVRAYGETCNGEARARRWKDGTRPNASADAWSDPPRGQRGTEVDCEHHLSAWFSNTRRRDPSEVAAERQKREEGDHGLEG